MDRSVKWLIFAVIALLAANVTVEGMVYYSSTHPPKPTGMEKRLIDLELASVERDKRDKLKDAWMMKYARPDVKAAFEDLLRAQKGIR